MPELLRSQRIIAGDGIIAPGNHLLFTPEEYVQTRAEVAHMDEYAHKTGIDDELPGYALVLPTSYDMDGSVYSFSDEELDSVLPAIDIASKRVEKILEPTPKDKSADGDFQVISEYGVKPLRRHLRHVVARYAIRSCRINRRQNAYYGKSTVSATKKLLDELPDLATDIKKHDIPAYTALFNEFDRLRHEEGGIVEAYMGRDGIFAYFARLGQLAARGDNEPGHMGTNTDLEVPPADPRYVVFSSVLRDSGLGDVKRRYLETVLSPDENIYCFDTGFRGSVPENVLLSLGFHAGELDRRIKLLVTNDMYSKRQLPGVRESYDSDVDYEYLLGVIENKPQIEETSEDIIATDNETRYLTKGLISSEDEALHLVARHLLYKHFLASEHRKLTREFMQRTQRELGG